MTVKLRKYQEECITKVLQDAIFMMRVLFVLPTGAGKSIVMAELINRIKKNYPKVKILSLVHTRELVEQNALAAQDLGLDVGIYNGAIETVCDKDIIFGTVQSMFKFTDLIEEADYVIIDECERIDPKAVQYGSVLDNMKTSAKLIGCTATPYRLGTGMLTDKGKNGELPVFNKISCEVSLTRLTKEGYLVPLVFRYGTSKISIDTGELKVVGNKYTDKSVTAYLDKHDLVPDHIALVQEILAKKIGTKGLVCAANAKHAQELYKEAIDKDIKAVYIHSKLGNKDRAKKIRDIKAGKYDLIINIDILLIGFNYPELDFCLFIRPTKSKRIMMQSFGRLTRTAPNKKHAVVYDLVGAIDEHGIPYEADFNYMPPVDFKETEETSVKSLGEIKEEEALANYKMKIEEYKTDIASLEKDYGKGTYIFASDIKGKSVMTKAGVPAIKIDVEGFNIRNQEKDKYTCWFNVYHDNPNVANLSRNAFIDLFETRADPFENISPKQLLIDHMQTHLNCRAVQVLADRIFKVSYQSHDFKRAFPKLQKIII